ncbi:MAG: hypothetical protein E6J37_04450 [Chloroflexi bacterium]|nr:MAG: hypothetical protein E6J37_04450 [Chloroflexota bacterium]
MTRSPSRHQTDRLRAFCSFSVSIPSPRRRSLKRWSEPEPGPRSCARLHSEATRAAYAEAVAIVKDLIATSGSVTVAQLRDRMGASRRPVLALLEHLDGERVTRRVGDQRVLFR